MSGYDPSCADLAAYFLSGSCVGEPPDTLANIDALAQVIQDAIEGWYGDNTVDAEE